MRKIYLASDSKARRELLKNLGLKFEILISRIKEIRKKGSLSYPALVKANALAKAESVARRVKEGVIIAADTITLEGKEIFGKPKNLTDAKKMLKRLSRHPQWVYTGIAIIDKDSGRTLLDYEKTRVYMDRLNEKEIDNYFVKVSPLDKAGSFDIQGKGALFIRRIDGCFYNVVGMPLRKLYRMFKRLKIDILMFLFIVFLSGCASEYNIVTQQEETYLYSTDREIQIGQSIAKEVEKEYKLVDDPLIQKLSLIHI